MEFIYRIYILGVSIMLTYITHALDIHVITAYAYLHTCYFISIPRDVLICMHAYSNILSTVIDDATTYYEVTDHLI